jgi:hypothetical protein
VTTPHSSGDGLDPLHPLVVRECMAEVEAIGEVRRPNAYGPEQKA